MNLNIIKAIYKNPIANITLKGEKQTIFIKVRNETKCPLSPLLFNIVSVIPSQSNNTEGRNKRDSHGEGRSQAIPICRYDFIPKRP
jgi:hypothetical protein